jgi:hypothetical protein
VAGPVRRRPGPRSTTSGSPGFAAYIRWLDRQLTGGPRHLSCRGAQPPEENLKDSRGAARMWHRRCNTRRSLVIISTGNANAAPYVRLRLTDVIGTGQSAMTSGRRLYWHRPRQVCSWRGMSPIPGSTRPDRDGVVKLVHGVRFAGAVTGRHGGRPRVASTAVARGRYRRRRTLLRHICIIGS